MFLIGIGTMMVRISMAQVLIDSLAQDETKIIESIAPYSQDVRSAILDVSQYPQVLVKLERTQTRASQSFQDLVATYPRDEQEKFYQASRYPDLINQLIVSGKKSSEEVKVYLKDYPEATQQQILDVYKNHYGDLSKMNDIYQASQSAMENITTKYPEGVRSNFKKVIATPDVMNMLTDHIGLAVSLGQAYKDDPNGITQHLDSLNAKLTDQSSKDLAAYKSAVEKDPKLQEEMKKAATEFAQQYDQQDTNPSSVTNNQYDNYPYPYWFGYPYWYNSPMWYPSPFYYQTGFYYGAGGGMVVFGLPSHYYSNWFFGYGHGHYPGLYGYYNNYYNVHRTNIANHNVYRGFNTSAQRHFSSFENHSRTMGAQGNPGGRKRTYQNTYTPHPANNAIRTNAHINQMNVRPGNFNNSGFHHYNSSSFHNMGWQHVGGVGGGRGRH